MAELFDQIMAAARAALPAWVPREIFDAYVAANRDRLVARLAARGKLLRPTPQPSALVLARLTEEELARLAEIGNAWASEEEERRREAFAPGLRAMGPAELADFVSDLKIGRRSAVDVGAIITKERSLLLKDALAREYTRRGVVGSPDDHEAYQQLIEMSFPSPRSVLSDEKRALVERVDWLRGEISKFRPLAHYAVERGALDEAEAALPSREEVHGFRTANDLTEMIDGAAGKLEEAKTEIWRRADVDAVNLDTPAPAWTGRSDFSDRRERRVAGLSAAAARQAEEAESRFEASNRGLPDMGQPILVGHHSEGRHRAAIKRAHGNMRKSVDARQAAEDYSRRAASAASNKTISSDDPDAPDKIRARIAALEDQVARAKQLNKALKGKNPRAALSALGIAEDQHERLLVKGITPTWSFTNKSANIRRLKERLQQVEKAANTAAPADIVVGDGTATWDTETNRVVVDLPRPRTPEEKKARHATMRAGGFVWSPSRSSYVRQANTSAWWSARNVLESIFGRSPDAGSEPAAVAVAVSRRADDTRRIESDLGGDGSSALDDGRVVDYEINFDDSPGGYRYRVRSPNGGIVLGRWHDSRGQMQKSGELKRLLRTDAP